MPENQIDIGIPWKVMAASPDMMDVIYNNQRFPYAWRSSLAISVYEPLPADLPSHLCEQKIAFVKLTASLTGYQVNGSEINGKISFGNEPLEELTRLTTEYLGCYGALLNVAFFPPSSVSVNSASPSLEKYPHILDFSPKSRELIRSITETGEMLTGSNRSLGIDQSLTTTNKSESTVGLEAGYEAAGLKAKGSISHTWGTTNEDKHGLNIASSTNREQNQRFTTETDQLYSLLTGYHSGTNRATFIILARPNISQPTSRRTFAQGLRMLEGVQDFIFVVSRPEDQDGLCIEAMLNTGHYPEAVQLVGDERQLERRTFIFTIHARATGGSEGFFSFQGQEIRFGGPDRPEDTFTLPPSDDGGEWIIDVDAPGTNQGIERGTDRSSPAKFLDLSVARMDDTRVVARGRVVAQGGHDFSSGPDTIVDTDFIIHVKRPLPTLTAAAADINQMLVTTRSLKVCYRTVDGCPQPSLDPLFTAPLATDWIDSFARPKSNLNGSQDSVYSHITSTLIAGTNALGQGVTKKNFVETDYFSRKIAENLPKSIAQTLLCDIKVDLGKSGFILGKLSIKEFLSVDLRNYIRKAGLSEADALELRRKVLEAIEEKL
jgi:hypothetical protein